MQEEVSEKTDMVGAQAKTEQQKAKREQGLRESERQRERHRERQKETVLQRDTPDQGSN